MTQPDPHSPDVKEVVRETYAAAARQAASGRSACCGPSGAGGCDPITRPSPTW